MKIEAGTIARTAILIIALINQICAVTGLVPMDITNDQVYQIVSLICTIGTSVWSWWKNNSFTKEAIAADRIMKQNKSKHK